MFGLGLLAKAGGWAAKAVGLHLLGGRGAVGELEGLVSAGGLRFVAGMCTAYYASNEQFRGGFNQCVGAILATFKGIIF